MESRKRMLLLKNIREKRNEMYIKAKHFGMTDPRVVVVSQDLDMLLNEYQNIQSY